MNKTLKLLRYSFSDLLRSKWLFVYALFFFLSAGTLLLFTPGSSKAVISMMNVMLLFVPLVSSVTGAMHLYHSREFIELLLAQPVNRTQVFLGNYLGAALALSAAYLIGLLIPFALHSFFHPAGMHGLGTLFITGVFLTVIFSALSYLIALMVNDKMKGFGTVIILWLFMTMLYDGLLLLIILWFRDYPLELPALILTMLNPIDLSRLLIMLNLDVAALMGFTGAVFQQFFGSTKGVILATVALAVWVVLPIVGIVVAAKRKDF